MPYRLIIAEKPSVGKAIAENLGDRVDPVRGSSGRVTHYIVGSSVVTWVFGHILELAEPEDYFPQMKKAWSESAHLLPIVPEQWRLKPVPSSKDQLMVIKGLLKECSEVVHAGDPDREGQLLVDEVLEYLVNKKPVKRILPNAIDDKSMKRILANIVGNEKYTGLYHAGLGRQRADWLVGMNMSRACSIANERSGMRGTLSVGRVQTPTLAMVVRRDLEIDNFKPQVYFDISADFKHANGLYAGRWSPTKGMAGLDSEGRLTDQDAALRVKSMCEGAAAVVSEYKVEESRQAPPMLFSLSGLQKKASEMHKLGAKKVLDICQALYEKKIATYPRTDCQYLPEDQFCDAAEVLKGIESFDPELGALARGANPAIRTGVWNSKKVTAHHAIVPTGEASFHTLTQPERQVFALIVKSFIAQFYPDYVYRQTIISTRVAELEFKSSGRTPVSYGWRKLFGAEEKAAKAAAKDDASGEDDQLLPTMALGEPTQCTRIYSLKKNTKPPARFTEGTLIHAMTNVHETISDPDIKKKLKEVKGLGTEATRSETIETLKRRLFVSDEVEPGKIISTAAGRSLIAALPKDLTDVMLTALWENALDQIERGAMPLAKFLEGQSQWIKKMTRQTLDSKISVGVGVNSQTTASALAHGAGGACPRCGKGTLRMAQAKTGANAGKYFLLCTQYPECKHTDEIEGQDEDKAKEKAKRGKKRS